MKTISSRDIREFHEVYPLWFNPKTKTHFRLPMIEVRFIGPTGRKIIMNALVDTGATCTFIPPSIAKILKLVKVRDSTAEGAGGGFSTWIAKVDVDYLHDGNTMASDRKIEIHIPNEEDRIPYIVLGRNGIFLIYDITIRECCQWLIFRRAKKR